MTHSPSSAQSEKVAPCPFCGGTAHYEFDASQVAPYGHYHSCNRCAMTTGSSPSKEAAIAAWNARAAASAHTIGEDAANVAIGEREAHCVNTCNFYNKNRPCECPAPQSDAAAWEAIFDRVAVELNCLPSSSPDGNEHVFHAIAKLRAALTAEKVQEPYGYAPVHPNGNYFTRNKSTADYVGGLMPVYADPQPAQPVAQTTGDTGNPEADRIIGRLSSSDPDFDDCADAVAFIHKLVVDHKGPDGFPTWKDAAIAERMRRVNLEDAAHRYQSCRASAIERGLFSSPEEYDAMVDDSLRKKGKEVLTGRGHNYGKKVAKDGSLYRPQAQPVAQTLALTDEQIEDLQEAREILENMVRSVELDGNYSTEATCTFLRQALLCLPAAQPASGGESC